jgi:hypothetical protein
MFTVMEIQSLKEAWEKSPIDFEQQKTKLGDLGVLKSLSYDG